MAIETTIPGMKSRRRIAGSLPRDCADDGLQRPNTAGICRRRNGVQRPFAQQQFLETDVRFGSKADIGLALVDVRFTPKSGHWAALL
jgi:hypothetical protein